MADITQGANVSADGGIRRARAAAQAAAAAAPQDPEPHVRLARIAEAEGQIAAAMSAWLAVAARAGADPAPWRELGRLSLASGRVAEAEMALGQAVARGPHHAPTRRALAAALAQAGRPADAVPHLLAAATHGAPPIVLEEAGDLAWRAGAPHQAVAIWQVATERDPARAPAWAKLARGRHSLGRYGPAADAAAAAAARDPSAGHLRLWGLLAKAAGRLERARGALERAMAADPDDPVAAWALAACVPAVCESAAHEEACLARYDTELAAVARLHARRPHDPRWPDAVQTAFPAHYLADDHRARQAAHGRLVAAAAAVVPPPPRAPRGADPRTHVVAVSAYLRDHTVHKLFTGWLRDLDRRRFRVTALACPGHTDAQTREAEATVDHFARLPADLPGALAAVAAAAPDILLFPELGMDPQVLRIAAHRLAPVQAVAWGHPISPGLPHIDRFLSSAAMEPGGPWTHEPRVDLPGLGLHLQPCPPPTVSRGRAGLGLPDDRALLLCVQTLAKYRAWTDDLHARVAQAAPGALLVFIEDPRPLVTQTFRARLARAFSNRGMRLDDHAAFLPRQGRDGWRSLLAVGDLFLDSPGWSGGNTTLEAIALGLPVLAFPGSTMRGRHSLGIVRELGLGAELVPADPDAWVARAAALATDGAARAALRRAVRARSPRLFADRRGVPALEAALLAILQAAGPEPWGGRTDEG